MRCHEEDCSHTVTQLLSRWGNAWKQKDDASLRWGEGELPKACRGRLKSKERNYTHRSLLLLQTTCFYKLCEEKKKKSVFSFLNKILRTIHIFFWRSYFWVTTPTRQQLTLAEQKMPVSLWVLWEHPAVPPRERHRSQAWFRSHQAVKDKKRCQPPCKCEKGWKVGWKVNE